MGWSCEKASDGNDERGVARRTSKDEDDGWWKGGKVCVNKPFLVDVQVDEGVNWKAGPEYVGWGFHSARYSQVSRMVEYLLNPIYKTQIRNSGSWHSYTLPSQTFFLLFYSSLPSAHPRSRLSPFYVIYVIPVIAGNIFHLFTN